MAFIDPSLAEYVQSSRADGYTDQMIREVLLHKGWQSQQVEEALSLGTLESRAPLPPAPIAIPKPPIATYPDTPSIHSPFSVVLAIVLFVFLLIFGYHVIADLDNLFTSISAQLAIDAAVVLPFLLAATALHASLINQKEKYRTLTAPFFGASAWLLLKLLFDVSQYVYGNVAVYGVYIVLLMVVIVLTAMTLLLQKYKDKI